MIMNAIAVRMALIIMTAITRTRKTTAADDKREQRGWLTTK